MNKRFHTTFIFMLIICSLFLSGYKWNTLMSDADPDDYLSLTGLTYPSSGTNGNCNHVSLWSGKARELTRNRKLSDASKVHLFATYLADNYAYDEYRAKSLDNVSRANHKFECGEKNAWKDDSNFMYYNHVGTCWDYTNAMVIMCRTVGIAATSVENDDHTMTAVYIDGHWTAIDITAIVRRYCDTEDTSKAKWKEYKNVSSSRYKLYPDDMTSHDGEVWTSDKATGKTYRK